jgi:hypothetical protein
MAEHTPGPWTYREPPESLDRPIAYWVDGPGAGGAIPIADIVTNIPEAEANARLIQAAPDLLQVAYLAVEMGWGGEHHPDCDDEGEEPVTGCICGLSEVFATIAKAEGRA